MNLIEIKISENRMVETETLSAGIMGENEATRLKIKVPEDYSSFYKYLDIIKSDGTKTQAFVDGENDTFYFDIPYSLTEGSEICLQLVAKKGNKVFKSNAFTLYFGGSVEATQILSADYQDTIEYLMENKTDVSRTSLLEKKVDNKAEKSEVKALELMASQKLNLKVDKEEGKVLSSNDYTDYEKEKLYSLPTRTELESFLDKRVEKISLYYEASNPHSKLPPIYKTDFLDEYSKSGVYDIIFSNTGVTFYNADNFAYYRLYVGRDLSLAYFQLLEDCGDGSARKRTCNTFSFDGKMIWSEWEVCNNTYSTNEKDKLSDLPDKETLNASLNLKVDKEGGKALSTNDYTDEEREKLELLPDNEELETTLNSKVSIITFEREEDTPIYETDLLDVYTNSGIYYIVVNDAFDVYEREAGQIYRLVVTDIPGAEHWQYLKDCMNGSIRHRHNASGEWCEWEIIDEQYSHQEKDKLKELPDKETLNASLNLKVDKEEGKMLSSNDYTDEEKIKLSDLPTGEDIENRFKSLTDDITAPGDNVANAIKNTVSGVQLVINDLSPVTHKMNLMVSGKNRIKNDWETGWINTTTGVNQTVGSNMIRTKGYTAIAGGKTYCLSVDFSKIGSISVYFYDENKKFVSRTALSSIATKAQTPTRAKFLRVSADAPLDILMQFEKGTQATDFEEYINPQTVKVTVNEEEYIPDEYGFVDVKSSYPKVNISSDNELAEIQCTYNKDINKVIGELTNAIISLGGNV